MPIDRDPAFEKRLEELRREARAGTGVNGHGVDVAGGPIPPVAMRGDKRQTLPDGRAGSPPRKPGYYGMPVIKPPVWTLEIPLYFFIGGMSGMAGPIAAAAWFTGRFEIARAAMWLAAFGGVVSPVLLIMDLGRPRLFFNMLRIIKVQSPMSMGVYILSAFGTAAIPGACLVELAGWHLLPSGIWTTLLGLADALAVIATALAGVFLATYTGVLIGATVVPVWFTHRRILPLHFGTAGLGSAASMLELFGYRSVALGAIAWTAIGVEVLLWIWMLLHRKQRASQALHGGVTGALMNSSECLTGPVALVLRALGWTPWAALAFLVGSLFSRFGWVRAGKASATDPEAVFASQR
jgi:hypothetical protein